MDVKISARRKSIDKFIDFLFIVMAVAWFFADGYATFNERLTC